MRRVAPDQVHFLLYPATVPLIASGTLERPAVAPAVWTTSLSANPPLVATALAPERYTYRAVRETGFFTVNLLDFSLVKALALLGDVSARQVPDKAARAGVTLAKARSVPTVAVAEAAAVVECRVRQVVDVGGDHDLFVGEVVEAYASDDFGEGGWRLERYRPILYLGRTRRPGPVRRRFATAGQVVDVDYAAGHGEAAARRKELYEAVERGLEELAARLGLDTADLLYLALDVARGRLHGRGP